MHTEAKQDKFIELRAQGWTLGHIATELGVCKRTLVDWNQLLAAEVQAFRAFEQKALQEKFVVSREQELDRLLRFQKDIGDELANRTLKFMDTEKLFRLSVELRREILQLQSDRDPEESKPRQPAQRPNGHRPAKSSPRTGRTPAIPKHETEAEVVSPLSKNEIRTVSAPGTAATGKTHPEKLTPPPPSPPVVQPAASDRISPEQTCNSQPSVAANSEAGKGTFRAPASVTGPDSPKVQTAEAVVPASEPFKSPPAPAPEPPATSTAPSHPRRFSHPTRQMRRRPRPAWPPLLRRGGEAAPLNF